MPIAARQARHAGRMHQAADADCVIVQLIRAPQPCPCLGLQKHQPLQSTFTIHIQIQSFRCRQATQAEDTNMWALMLAWSTAPTASVL